MCCFSVSFTRLSLLLLVAITQSSRSIPLGVVTFAWDDSTGSGIGEIEEPIATLKDNNGQEPFVQISSNKWELNNDHEKALPEAERVSNLILLIPFIEVITNKTLFSHTLKRCLKSFFNSVLKSCKISEIYLGTAEFIFKTRTNVFPVSLHFHVFIVE